MKKMYVKPTLKTVEWDFQNPVCNSGICQLSAKCITSEHGSVDTKMNNFNGSLDWHDYNSVTVEN